MARIPPGVAEGFELDEVDLDFRAGGVIAVGLDLLGEGRKVTRRAGGLAAPSAFAGAGVGAIGQDDDVVAALVVVLRAKEVVGGLDRQPQVRPSAGAVDQGVDSFVRVEPDLTALRAKA